MKRPFGRGITRILRGLTITMVINHLQVMGWSSKWWPAPKPHSLFSGGDLCQPRILLLFARFSKEHLLVKIVVVGCFPKIVGFPPKSSILIGFFHCKPSILGYPYFWKYPVAIRKGIFFGRELQDACIFHLVIQGRKQNLQKKVGPKGVS